MTIKLKAECELAQALDEYDRELIRFCIDATDLTSGTVIIPAPKARAHLLEVIRDMLTRFLPRSAANEIMGAVSDD